ncbi:amidohydrolase family protein [Spirosoma taeanense]|uniref:Amidohydrolase family protein n=1 Tax=Spirosoma taeanense TaxID=2735870 RepID=A0A6M5Y8D0_9BACT|nr:amidohydrolase family protein [Spirosoma taeanense]QJW90558.1 amidohydrolase family protein [Spirosoma taeanense]
MKKILISILTLTSLTSFGQNPAPARPQARMIALMGGTIHIGNGQVIPNGVIVFENGIISNVADATTVRLNTSTMDVIDVTGKHVYPGLISPASTVGLQEIGAVRSTVDKQEIGVLNPNVRALIAYNTDSEIIPTIRNNGVLLTQAMPQGGTVSGSSSVMMADGWNWEDAVLKRDDGIWLNWPAYFARSFDIVDFSLVVKKNEKRSETIGALEATFGDAKAYAALTSQTPKNLKLESMRGLFSGKQNLYIRADYGKDIIEAVQFAKSFGVPNVVIVGGEEAHRVASFLKDNNVPVILSALHRLPNREDEDVDLPYRMPGILQKAGVLVSLSYADEWWRTRNLPFLAGTAVGFGINDREEALKMVTSNTAKILGVDNLVGTLEKGKQATLFVSAGDALDMRTNVVEQAYVQGRKVNLDDRHKRLYKTYKEKYEQK